MADIPIIFDLASKLTFGQGRPPSTTVSLPASYDGREVFMDSWLDLAGREDPIDRAFHEQLLTRGVHDLERFSLGNYNEHRIKTVLNDMKQDGAITSFRSCAKKLEENNSVGKKISQNSSDMIDQNVKTGENLSDDSLKTDVLICKLIDDKKIICPIQIKSQRQSGFRKSQIILSNYQLNELNRLFPQSHPLKISKRAPGSKHNVLPAYYKYGVIHEAWKKSKTDLKKEINRILSTNQTFESMLELEQLKGFELLKTLIQSGLLVIGHPS